MANAVLSLNAGSSSLKFALFAAGDEEPLPNIARGEIEAIGSAPRFIARDSAGATLAETKLPEAQAATHERLLGSLLGWIESHLQGGKLVAAGHRVVHGGQEFADPVRITPEVLAALERLVPLAPLHQPHCLTPVRALRSLRPGLAQVACFDTAFHVTLPPVARRFALPRAYESEGVRRYGFHGLSYEYIASELRRSAPDLASGRVVVAHLGNGASLCAMHGLESLDTTMGFTALDGLMMGTRPGALDPGVVLYMLREKGLRPKEVEDVLYRHSGLLGVSGISSDVRVLLESDDAHAREAIELFVYRVARETAGLAGILGGLDGFVFTAGIGENATAIRAAVCRRLRWLGIELDEAANAAGARLIAKPKSQVAALVIPTDEEVIIARHTLATLAIAGD